MKTQSKILCFSIFLFACLELNAQSSDTEKILEQLTILQEGKGGSSGDDEGSSDGYKSFVMNEFKNTVNSLNQLDIDEQQQIFFKELNEKRLELAVQLCQTDQRACFLMDQYREYDYLEQLSKITWHRSPYVNKQLHFVCRNNPKYQQHHPFWIQKIHLI